MEKGQRLSGPLFLFIYAYGGKGRLGISISKKILRRATARNRVKRLLKEAFRKKKQQFATIDIHIIGRNGLTENWETLKCESVEKEFQKLEQKMIAKGAT